MQATKLGIEGLLLIHPKVFGDQRGFFYESWNQAKYNEIGIPENFTQDNISFSQKGVLRGLHFQNPFAQGKLVTVLNGEVLDVAVDLRKNSPTYGKHEKVVLSSENKKQLYIPPGFAHGFMVWSETALFTYKCTEYYHPETENTLMWNDDELAINWFSPNEKFQPIVSEKDRQGCFFNSIGSISC
ncbi:MAG: dTDP-4-dehydrorhamnose 3,5-epimerase [Candidatus Caenarcaniphilales bacterium]|nr:dTDP-4-dehydrorhamnose 3,5-epimerase [Candidatus Caenarcaniphilales bacterium]